MFSRLFGRKRASRDPDRVFMSKDAKWRSLKAETGVKFVAHFPVTRREIQEQAGVNGQAISVTLAKELTAPFAPDPNLRVVVIERHPLREHDEQICAWADAAASSIVFLVSLDDALLAGFAGNIRPLLERLGAGEGEPLESAMLSRSILKAQDKIRKGSRGDLPADSDEAWIRLNGSVA